MARGGCARDVRSDELLSKLAPVACAAVASRSGRPPRLALGVMALDLAQATKSQPISNATLNAHGLVRSENCWLGIEVLSPCRPALGKAETVEELKLKPDRYLHFDTIDVSLPEIVSQCSACGMQFRGLPRPNEHVDLVLMRIRAEYEAHQCQSFPARVCDVAAQAHDGRPLSMMSCDKDDLALAAMTTPQQRLRIQELCGQIEREEDPEKLGQLATELADVLETLSRSQRRSRSDRTS